MKKIYLACGFYANDVQAGGTKHNSNQEACFDADPEVGNGSAVAVAIPLAIVTLNPSISTFAQPGFIPISIRTKDATLACGLFENRTIYLSSFGFRCRLIVSAEYFIGTDPGVKWNRSECYWRKW